VVVKLRERLSVSKQTAQKFHMQIFDLGKLNDAEVKEQYQVKISNRFVALRNLDDNVDINNAWKNIRENINNSAKESPGHELNMNHGLMKNVQNYYIQGSRLNWSGCRTQAK
jgi:hypothetical protein